MWLLQGRMDHCDDHLVVWPHAVILDGALDGPSHTLARVTAASLRMRLSDCFQPGEDALAVKRHLEPERQCRQEARRIGRETVDHWIADPASAVGDRGEESQVYGMSRRCVCDVNS